ncbi:hypothetical protein [Salinisphaera sp. Q1T1-3]|uniref:hypothetical protein n=1 Tax=Salinisphaera sp. Q1T1-3 TaxID=2321229 RepID=UPI0011C44650|nr:hypothetical protein [Salinisphaera sp. Q1T1-3]
MRNFVLVALVLVLVVGCGSSPTASELIENYRNAPQSFEALRVAITEDSGDRKCFAIGLDHIGDYWKYGESWTHENDYKTKLTTNQVLSSLDISLNRYEYYKDLFAATGSERVTYCKSGRHYVPSVYVMVYRAGLGVSGCMGNINWSSELPPNRGKRGEGDFVENTPIEDGWYLAYECT